MLGRADHAKIVRLRSTGEVDAWLAVLLRMRETAGGPQLDTVEAG
jgi:hypothetical protein